jgi:hypothetical protein
MLWLSSTSEADVHDFFLTEFRLKRRYLKSQLHLSVYHARRPLLGLNEYEEHVDVAVNTQGLRFMVMAPGGENPRPDIDPSANPIGVRLQRGAPAMEDILALRRKFYSYESPRVLGRRRPSTDRRSAFGAHEYQPHIALLRRGSGLEHDLRRVSSEFRARIGSLRFDRFTVKFRSPLASGGRNGLAPTAGITGA